MKKLQEAIYGVMSEALKLQEWYDYNPSSPIFKKQNFRRALLADETMEPDTAYKDILAVVKKWSGIQGRGGEECAFFGLPDTLGKTLAKAALKRKGDMQLREWLHFAQGNILDEKSDGHARLYIYPLTDGDQIYMLDLYLNDGKLGYELNMQEGNFTFDDVFEAADKAKMVRFGTVI